MWAVGNRIIARCTAVVGVGFLELLSSSHFKCLFECNSKNSANLANNLHIQIADRLFVAVVNNAFK